MKNLEFQIRLENLKPDNLINERLERILKLAERKNCSDMPQRQRNFEHL